MGEAFLTRADLEKQLAAIEAQEVAAREKHLRCLGAKEVLLLQLAELAEVPEPKPESTADSQ